MILKRNKKIVGREGEGRWEGRKRKMRGKEKDIRRE